jgi:hypothetical protein
MDMRLAYPRPACAAVPCELGSHDGGHDVSDRHACQTSAYDPKRTCKDHQSMSAFGVKIERRRGMARRR